MKRQICLAATLLALCNGVDAFASLARNAAESRSWRLSPSDGSHSKERMSPAASTARTSTVRTSTTSLQMAVNPTAIAAIGGAITGGLFAGSLHAVAGKLKQSGARTAVSSLILYGISCFSLWRPRTRRYAKIPQTSIVAFVVVGFGWLPGPDHLAALLPRCCGQRWYRAGRVGALWGMGHGLSATILGVTAFGLKNQVKNLGGGAVRLLAKMSHATDIAVGLSLVLIGVMGIKEAREWEEEIDGVQPQSLSAAAADAGIKVAEKRAVIFNGLLHGFSWDGAPSLAPALAVATWSGNLAFLSAYALGTMGAMAIVTTLIGEGTRRTGQIFNRPDIPQKLSLFSSFVAIAVGAVWCGLALK